jgi:protein TonB
MLRRFGLCVTAFALFGAVVLAQQQVYSPDEDGVTLPVVEQQQRAYYTQAALAARIEGVVGMDAVVLAGGTVGDVTVTQSLDSDTGLDQQAVDALKRWVFKPGTKDGKAVAVQVHVLTRFTLK